jgi:hypothetical protein
MAALLTCVIGIVANLALFVVLVFAWLTHVMFCIKTASWILLFIGAIGFPIGIVHGVMIWFGAA